MSFAYLPQAAPRTCIASLLLMSVGADDQGRDQLRWSDGPRLLETGSEHASML